MKVEKGSSFLGSRRDFMQAAIIGAAGFFVRSPLFAEAPAQVNLTLKAQRLAWAGIKLQTEEATIFLDPLANPDVWGPALQDSLIPVEVTQGERFVLITHRHPDHFDPGTVRKALGESGTLVCTPEIAPSATGAGLKVRSAPLYQPVLLQDFTATAVPAVDGYGDPQVSWVVGGGGRRIIHCGDTLWHGAWWHIGRQLGPFDAAFLPINGARFEWRKPVSDVPAVMTPEQAVAAAIVLGARLLVPIHYGVVGGEGYSEVPNPEAALIKEAKRRNLPLEIARPGEWLTWHERVK